jgi:hypothetical protein
VDQIPKVRTNIRRIRIRDILVRSRILRSVPLINGSGCGSSSGSWSWSSSVSCSFRQYPSRCLFLFEGTFISFFTFFACWWRIRIRNNKLWIRMRIQEA